MLYENINMKKATDLLFQFRKKSLMLFSCFRNVGV